CRIDGELRDRLTRARNAGTFSSVNVDARMAAARFDVRLETERGQRRFFEEAWTTTCAEIVEWVVYTFELLQDEQEVNVRTALPTLQDAVLGVDAGPEREGPRTVGLLLSTGVEASSSVPGGPGLGASIAVGADFDHARVLL